MNLETPWTLFICNIAITLPDSFITTILKQFGALKKWKRGTNVKGEALDFGFADYGSPNDILKALRIVPYIRVLDQTWVARVDRSIEADLSSYQAAKQMKPGYNMQSESREDQVTITMIEKLIQSTSFARVLPRMQEIINSPNDQARESEHFRYLADIRRENDELERSFRDSLVDWRILESNKRLEFQAMEKSNIESQSRMDRRIFLHNWERPILNDVSNEEEVLNYITQMKMYYSKKSERLLIRQKEMDFDSLAH